jgi:trimeric autotransporter adhesin
MKENRKARRARKIAAATLAGSMLLFGQPLSAIQQAYAADSTVVAPSLQLVDERIVSTGVTLRSYQWNGAAVSVIAADLTNPYVKLDVMTGQAGQFPKRETVLNMSKQTGAIAGINADFFDPGNSNSSPFGPQVSNGTFMGSTMPGLTGMYAFGITKDNQPVIDLFSFKGEALAANGQKYSFSVINKTPGKYAMAMYTGAWGSKTRGSNETTPPTEVLVADGIVQQISIGAPIDGLPPQNGYILRTTGAGTDFVTANVRVGEPLVATYTLSPASPGLLNAAYTQDSFKMLIGGHTILVDQGVPAAFSRDVSSIGGTRSRSAVGFSQDAKTVYLVGVERSNGAGGVKLGDLQKILVQLGVWKAVNLDGGGSTTVVSRPLGDFQAELVNKPEDGSMRKVVNGIGVYSTAPMGELQGLMIGGAELLWKGETTKFLLKAYDTHYNPLDPFTLAATPVWSVTEGNAIASPTGEVTATAAGKATIAVAAGAVQQSKGIEITDSNAIVKLDVSADKPSVSWVQGGSYKLTVTATLADGRQRAIPAELVRWERVGINGMMDGDQLHFAGFAEGVKDAMLIARYDGYSTRLSAQVPQTKLVSDFEAVPYGITFTKYPDVVQGAVTLSDAYNPGNKSLVLRYDYTAGDDTTDKAAYATFNGDQGIALTGEPNTFLVDVYSDANAGWLRAEFADKDGNIIRKTLADKLDWNGWKTLAADLTGTGAVKLKRIYLVSKAQMSGEIAIDNMTLGYPAQSDASKIQVKMTVGKKDVTINGQRSQLDQPPVVASNRTFVPLRFIVDALGGTVGYDNIEKKVTIRKGTHLVELWLTKQDLISDGERVTSDVTPLVHKGRTLLPIRIVSEELGLRIGWDQKKQEVTVEEGMQPQPLP